VKWLIFICRLGYKVSLDSEKREKRFMRELIKFLKGEEGVTAIEYGLIAALIAIVIIAAVTLAGQNLAGIFQQIAAAL
jgi:pilus assembly protein Flp/PilA